MSSITAASSVPDDRDLTRAVMELTGITANALARKLRVQSKQVSIWAEAEATPPPGCLARIRKLWERTQIKEAAVKPRLKRPQLESRVICADCIRYIKEIPEESVDMILSDIPYGIGLDDWDVLHDNRNSAYLGSSEAQRRAGEVFKRRRKPINGWSSADRRIPAQYQAWCERWVSHWFRVLRPGGSAILFAGRRLAHRCICALEEAGFNYRDLLAWLRSRAVYRAQRLSVVYQKRGDLAEARSWDGWRVGNLRPTFEPIIWCFKPYAATIADNMLDHNLGAMNADRYKELTGSLDNVLRFGFESGEAGLHEAQKPVALLRALIELCTVEDQVVLDPFAGSGSTALAAAQTNRRWIAIERDKTLCESIKERLEAHGSSAQDLKTGLPA